MTATGGAFQLPTFSTPSTTAATSSAGLFGNPAATSTLTPQQQTSSLGGGGNFLFGPPSAGGFGTGPTPPQGTHLTPSIGLGGQPNPGQTTTTTATGSLTLGSEAKPKDGHVPPELTVLIDDIKKKLKENKDISDQIATESVEHIKSMGGKFKQAVSAVHRVDVGVKRCNLKAAALAEESRNDLRQAECVQRRGETIPAHHIISGSPNRRNPISYLHSLIDGYEKSLKVYKQQVDYLDAIIAAKMTGQDPEQMTEEQILSQLKILDERMAAVTSRVGRLHWIVQDVKDSFMEYKRTIYGQCASSPFGDSKYSETAQKTSRNIERGPDPFSAPSQSILMNMAQILGSAKPETGTVGAGNSSLFSGSTTMSTNLFGGAGAKPGGFSGFSGTNPMSGTTANTGLFKPWSSTTTSGTGLTNSGPGQQPLFTGFGASSSTGQTANNSNTQSQFPLFGKTLNSSMGGTLFGGSAARPFGK